MSITATNSINVVPDGAGNYSCSSSYYGEIVGIGSDGVSVYIINSTINYFTTNGVTTLGGGGGGGGSTNYNGGNGGHGIFIATGGNVTTLRNSGFLAGGGGGGSNGGGGGGGGVESKGGAGGAGGGGGGGGVYSSNSSNGGSGGFYNSDGSSTTSFFDYGYTIVPGAGGGGFGYDGGAAGSYGGYYGDNSYECKFICSSQFTTSQFYGGYGGAGGNADFNNNIIGGSGGGAGSGRGASGNGGGNGGGGSGGGLGSTQHSGTYYGSGGNGGYGIYNNGTLDSLYNSQGNDSTYGPLFYEGNIFNYYITIISSFTSYGQLYLYNFNNNIHNFNYGIETSNIYASNFTTKTSSNELYLKLPYVICFLPNNTTIYNMSGYTNQLNWQLIQSGDNTTYSTPSTYNFTSYEGLSDFRCYDLILTSSSNSAKATGIKTGSGSQTKDLSDLFVALTGTPAAKCGIKTSYNGNYNNSDLSEIFEPNIGSTQVTNYYINNNGNITDLGNYFEKLV
jgi:hypothetical protein